MKKDTFFKKESASDSSSHFNTAVMVHYVVHDALMPIDMIGNSLVI